MNWNAVRIWSCAGLLAVGGTACASADGGAAGEVVTIKLIAFTPTETSIPAGQTVTWRQEDVATHTVTSGRVEHSGGTATAHPDGRFDSGDLSKGQTFEFEFRATGEFPFFCAIHPATMTGVVTVS